MRRSARARSAPVHFVKTGKQLEEVAKCRLNPFYFIHNYIRITHQMKGDIPFAMYPFQAAIMTGWLRHQATCLLKPRQMGMSTLVAAYLLWMWTFHPNKDLLLVSIKQSTARALMRRVKFMYNHLPDYLKMEVVNGGARGSVGTADMMVGANGSTLEMVGSTQDAGRSGSYSLVVFDEAAFQRFADTTFGAAGPATLNNGGQLIVLSTAFGVGNFFHKTYTGGISGENGFHSQRLKWQHHPDYTQEWHDQQLSLLGRLRTAQEIDCNFLQSGYNVFDMGKIRAIEDRIRELEPDRREDGRLLLYEKPIAGVPYWLSADVASGRARDSSAFSIMYNQGGKGIEAGCFKGKLGVRDFGNLMMKVGTEYNMATLAPEINAIGEGVMATIQGAYYPNVYHTVSNVLRLGDYSDNDRAFSDVMGWLTTSKTRSEIITGLDDDLSDETLELNNPFFVGEANSFVYGANNRAAAMGKGSGREKVGMYEEDSVETIYSDDSIMAAGIGNAVRKAPSRFTSPLPVYG